MTEQPMFDVEEASFLDRDRVVVQTIWGDEKGTIVDYRDGLYQVALQRGDTIYINPTRVRPDPNS